MVIAYILVRMPGAEKAKEHISGIPGVKEVHIVYGGYDLLVKVEVEDMEDLGKIVFNEIRNRFPVEETTTLIVAD